MNTGIIIALLAAIFSAGIGIFIALYALGFFQYLGGKKPSANAVSKETLYQKITNLNNPSKPYRIIPGGSENTDLVAEWKIADASWYGIFNKNGIKKVYKALLLLDEERHSVKCFEILGTVNWTAGTSGLIPIVHYSKSQFGGRILFQKSYGVAYGIKDLKSMEAGKVYEYKFDVEEIRGPIENTVKELGWEWVPVTAKRHAVCKSLPSNRANENGRSDNKCLKCGAPLRQGAKFCAACGASVVDEENVTYRDTSRKRRLIPWVLAGIGLIVIIIATIMIIKGDKQKNITEIANAVYFNDKGMSKVKEGRIEEAASLFKKAVKANPDNFNAWNNLGLALRKIGKKDDALKAYKHAIKIKPDFALVYKNLGILLEEMNNKKDASEAYHKYYELNPSASDAQTVKEKADRLIITEKGAKK